MKKQLWKFALALALLVALLALGTIAASAATEGYYTYTVSNGEAEITYFPTSVMGAITIPSTLGGYPVTGIGRDSFDWCDGVTSITIPEGVTRIEYYTFAGCNGLTSITVAEGNPVYHSAGNCLIETASKTLIVGCKTSVIPADGSVTHIQRGVFYHYNSLESITIPGSVTSIGREAFAGCNGVTSITVAEGNPVYHSAGNCLVETAAKTLVLGCNNSIIPADGSVTSIGEGAFQDLSNLTSITIPEGVTSIGESAFWRCKGLTSVTIPDSVKSIGMEAFASTGLSSIMFPSGVTSIEPCVVRGCRALTKIEVAQGNETYHAAGNCLIETATKTLTVGCQTSVIPDDGSVTTIGYEAFGTCAGLSKIVLPASITRIEAAAFWDNSDIKSIVVKGVLEYVGHGAFMHMDDSAIIQFTQSKPASTWDSGWQDYCNAIILWDGKEFVPTYSSEGLVYTQNGNAYTVTGYTGTAAYVEIPATYNGLPVTAIGQEAFYYCQNLASVIIPDSVTSIGSYALSDCHNLTSITIPASVTSIGNGAFGWCRGLTSIAVDAGNPVYHSAGNCIIETASKTLIAGCMNSVIPADGSVTSIGTSVFSGCSSLTSITIPASVTSIGDYAFYDCCGLTSIAVDADNPVYHSAGNCLIETASKTLIAGCNTSVIPVDGSVTSIGNRVFYDCYGLTSITIPDSVTSIGDEAFSCCWDLTSITFGENSQLTSIGEWAFSYCWDLTSITIPDSVTSIKYGAFDSCDGLTSITFESPTTVIYDSAYTISNTATIYGYEGSTAEAYAEKYGRTFVSLGVLYTPGDVDGVDGLDANDAIYLLYNVIFGNTTYPVNQPCDFNGDGVKDANDAIYLLYHVIFGAANYPLKN